jgi:putative heme-binding domain-containing protein
MPEDARLFAARGGRPRAPPVVLIRLPGAIAVGLTLRTRLLAAVGLLLCVPVAGRAADPLTQKPEAAPSITRAELGRVEAPKLDTTDLAQGPAPSWIWGEGTGRCVVRRQFAGETGPARLKATADNRMTVYLNGTKVASSDTWQEPVEVDVTKVMKAGRNELAVELDNDGASAAGLALKLAMTTPEGRVRYLVSDPSWQAAPARDAAEWDSVRVVGKMGDRPWGDVFAGAGASGGVPRDTFIALPGFKVEKLFTVPRETLGSWVAIGFDDKGRLLASDQADKGLCRITLPPVGSDQPVKVEPLDLKITGAQGILHAFGSLYLSVNGGPGSGLYRARDTNDDDRYDEVVKLKDLRGGGEHGPHALRLTPDGKGIMLMSGNHTLPPEPLAGSRPPQPFEEDLFLPRQWDANGHARGILAPGGWAAITDPEGKSWELFTTGYRNAYDFAFDAEGEMFAYDSDMEWDMGSPWYRPTRATHSTSGSHFGWRSGTGKWPAYYVDSLPPLLDIGPGSPVGVTFGHGAKFPAKYQKALYLLDWTFGTIYALHLEPEGSTYRATKEEFLARTPLPLTDAAVGPDGAFYFTIGGRGTQSELYRVTYVGDGPTAPAELVDPRNAALRAERRAIEGYHRKAADGAAAVAKVYPYLSHEDRFIRYAARVALEHQDVALWRDKVLAEADPEALITGIVALAHQGDKALQPRLLEALDRLDYAALGETQKLELLRAWQVVFMRTGAPDAATASRLAAKLDALYPAATDPQNRELCNLLVYLQSPTVAAETIALMHQPLVRTPPEGMAELLARNAGYGGAIAKMMANMPDGQKLHYAFALRNLKAGWTLPLRKAYFDFLQQARTWSGGASYPGFINNIDKDAFENASEAERLAIEATGARQPFRAPELPTPRGPGREWSMDELLGLGQSPLKDRDYEGGRRAFAAARCILCHRFGGEGGATGPDLTQAAGRFAFKDLAEAIVEPSRVISDQFRASLVATADGQVYTGKVVSETADRLTLVIDPEDATKVVDLEKSDVDEIKPSDASQMPADLLKPLNREEVLDLMAYLLSRGDPSDPMFRRPAAGAGARRGARAGR